MRGCQLYGALRFVRKYLQFGTRALSQRTFLKHGSTYGQSNSFDQYKKFFLVFHMESELGMKLNKPFSLLNNICNDISSSCK